MNQTTPSMRDFVILLAQSQKVTLSLAKAVNELAIGDVPEARETMKLVAEYATTAEATLSELAYSSGLIERG